MRFILLALLASCAVDVDELETTEQNVTSFGIATKSSTADLGFVDTGWAASSSTCVLSAITGNLGPGVSDGDYALSEAYVTSTKIGLNQYPFYRLYAHGGQTAAGWANNLVRGDAACVPYSQKVTASWPVGAPVNGVSPPVRIVDLATNRRCFLSRVVGGDGAFSLSTDSLRVHQVMTPDASHLTTGWYIEGTLHSSPSTPHGGGTATCVDFPAIQAEWGGAFGGATNPMTSGSGIKMCGLTGIYGTFTTANEGAILTAPRTQTGNWTMTVGAGKYAEADCVQ